VIAFEEHSRLLLIVHAVVGAALVASATHVVVWLWGCWRDTYTKYRGARLLAWITVGLFATEILLGLVIYPTYKVRTRIEYLEEPSAIVADYRARAATRERIEKRLPAGLGTAPVATPDPGEQARMSRWFDVKEHWVAFGFALAVALALVLSVWRPQRDGRDIAPIVTGMAVVCAATVWLATIVGLLVTSYRSIGA